MTAINREEWLAQFKRLSTARQDQGHLWIPIYQGTFATSCHWRALVTNCIKRWSP